MQWRVIGIVILILSMGIGCAQKTVAPVQLEEIPLVQAVAACQEKPPVYIEVPVPLPLPCQLKPLPEPVRISRQKKGKSNLQRVAHANTAARQGPTDGQWVNSVQNFAYAHGALYQVYGAVTQVTQLMFQPGEKVNSVLAGDTERWEIAQTTTGTGDEKREALAIKPKWPDIHTNLTINTSKRVYLVELHATQSTYMAMVSWQYPQEAGMMAVKQAEEAVTLAKEAPIVTQTPVERLNFDYTIQQTKGKGQAHWKPVRVFDDGSKTYLQFPSNLATMEAPVLFIRTAEGTNALVNYRVKGTTYIIDRLFDEARLHVGEKKPQIVTITRNVTAAAL